MSVFIKFLLIFILNIPFSISALNNEKLSIEINSGNTKTITFSIDCNNVEISEKISQKLEYTRRFKKINSNLAIKAMQTAGVDILIKLSLVEGKIHGEIHDVMQQKKLEEFEIKLEDNNNETLNKIANHIYQAWVGEPGIFNTSVIASANIDLNLSTLMQINYSNKQFKCISCPISYLSTIIAVHNHIFITKFCTQKRGFAIFSYNIDKKDFHRILSIANGSVFSPAVYNNELYFSAANENTTGIYSIADARSYMKFKNFKEFEASKAVKTLIKISNRIATCININHNLAIFCSNKNGKSAIFSMNRKNIEKGEKAKQISLPEYAYYDPALFSDQKICAIKTSEGKFHLVIIDLLKDGAPEKTLISKYYLSKPCWSPCGNWIAVSGREKGGKDQIILIHKSGKYIRTIHHDLSLKSPVWVAI